MIQKRGKGEKSGRKNTIFDVALDFVHPGGEKMQTSISGRKMTQVMFYLGLPMRKGEEKKTKKKKVVSPAHDAMT